MVDERERALLERVLAGETSAFGDLMAPYLAPLYRRCRRIMPTREDAEEATQEGLLRVFRVLDRYDPRRPFGPWVHRVVFNAALTYLAWTKRRPPETPLKSDDRPGGEVENPAITPDISDALDLWDALGRLPEEAFDIIALRAIEGCTNLEAALRLNISAAAAKSRYDRAIGALRIVMLTGEAEVG